MDTQAIHKGFDDIEMLDLAGSSSDAESVDSTPGVSSPDSDPEPVVLKDWLNSDQPLAFRFNSAAYAETVDSDESAPYTVYVNRMYKTLEGLVPVAAAAPQPKPEPIGVIVAPSSAPKVSQNDVQANDAFLQIADAFAAFRDAVDDDPEYEAVQSVLECLLANVFYADINARPVLLTQWINKFDHEPPEELVADIMLHAPKPYLHPLFWTGLLVKLVARGLLDKAVNVIASSQYDELAQTCPQLHAVIASLQSTLQTYTSMALKGQFSQWKLACCEFRDSFPKFRAAVHEPDHVIILEHIHSVLCVVTGLPKTISTYCTHWYEIFTCLALYQVRDDASLYAEYYDVAIKEKPPAARDGLASATEKCFRDVIEGNYLHVLTMIDEIDSATASGVARLLELKGLLSGYYVVHPEKRLEELLRGKTISEYLLTKFALQCLNNHPLVPVGIGLLLNADVVTSQSSIANNRQIIQQFLPHYTCKTNDDLEWSLTVCAKLGLVSTASQLYRIYGQKSLKEGFLYEALNMLVNCFNYDSLDDGNQEGIKEVHHIVWDLIFADCLVHNRPIDDQLINNIVDNKVDKSFEVHPIIKQCLSPYAVLVEFYRGLGSDSVYAQDKLSKLVHLLEFIHLPRRFVPLLLAQVLPFFDKRYVFRVPDVIVVIELIDNYEAQANDEERAAGEALYQHSVSQTPSADYDWRHTATPRDVGALLRLLRNHTASKIGQVYIE